MDKVKIGERLREFINSKFGKIKTAAELLEITPQNLNKYLNGKYLPGAELLAKLQKLGCDIEWLLLLKDGTYTSVRSEGKGFYVNGLTPEDSSDQELSTKDKIIISMAEEIQRLKDEVKELKDGVKVKK